MGSTDARREFLDTLGRLDAPPAVVLRDLVGALAGTGASGTRVPAGIADAWLLGQAREALHASQDRTRLGAWFTPADVARRLVAAAGMEAPASVLDPSCGGGAFLLAAHERWPQAGLLGRDIDPLAVEVTRAALDLAGAEHHRVVEGDGLAALDHPVDLVVGNPPFLSQLGSGTARDAHRRRALRTRFGDAVTPYVDEAGLFLLATARNLLADGGVAVLVVPEALLATADAAAVRAEVAARCDVEVVWRDLEGVFPGVPTCAVRLKRRAPVRRPTPPVAQPVDTAPARSCATGWSGLLADDVPHVDLPQDLPVLADVATATADFRDAYYLLARHVHEQADEASEGHRIVPVGLIDPAHLRWGQVPVRFAKRRWNRPIAVGLPESFAAKRLGPKVLLATQTQVLEALVDADGDLLPSTPVISLRTDRLWHLAAALTSPTLTAVALHRHAGAARARGAIKLSARQVLALPLPLPCPDWDRAADAIRTAHATADSDVRRDHVLRCGRAMARAYAPLIDHDLLGWWSARLPVPGHGAPS